MRAPTSQQHGRLCRLTYPTWVDGAAGCELHFTTDIWRIFSEAKGSALFHNTALDMICDYYISVGILTDTCHVFTVRWLSWSIQREAQFQTHCGIPIEAPLARERRLPSPMERPLRRLPPQRLPCTRETAAAPPRASRDATAAAPLAAPHVAPLAERDRCCACRRRLLTVHASRLSLSVTRLHIEFCYGISKFDILFQVVRALHFSRTPSRARR